MKIAYWTHGKTDTPFVGEGFAIYQKRLSNYTAFDYRELQAAKGKTAQSIESTREYERDEVLKALKPNDTLVLLDEEGKEFTSIEFGGFLQKLFNEGKTNLVFLSGGAYGFHKDIYARANYKIALSKMTFTHQMVRVVFAEQLYRAFTILKGEPYHH